MNISITAAAPGILANDTDADGDALTASIRTTVSNGTLSLKSNGRLAYVPKTGFVGTDSFTYWVTDPTSARTWTTVTFNVTNATPIAVNDSYLASKNTPLTIVAPGVLANDSDGDPLSATLVSQPVNGTVALASDGSFLYTPVTNYTGTDTFSYAVTDGYSSATATATITVASTNSAPAAGSDSYSLNQDTTLSIAAPGVLTNDSDSDGDLLTAQVASSPTHGTLNLASDGSFVYTPVTGYTGTDNFTYNVADGRGGNASATVTLTINILNVAPVAVNDAYITAASTSLTVATPGVLSNDTDPNGDTLTASKRTSPSKGTLTLKTDGRLVYVPTTGYNGIDSFTYWTTDPSGKRTWATVTLTVGTVNTPPVAGNDSYSTGQDTTLNVTAPGVLANDTDADGDPLTATITSAPMSGALNLNSDGSFTYTPFTGYSGADSFSYAVADNKGGSATATVSLNVIPTVNTPPVAGSDSYSTNQDTPLNVAAPGVLANDTDTEGDPLTAAIASAPMSGTLNLNSDGSFTYTPFTGYSGADSFSYTVADNKGGSAIATVTLDVAKVVTKATPNIILLLADDMRFDDAAYMPNLQALMATNSVVFPNAHTNASLCCPARSSILRGQYSHNHGVLDNDRFNGAFGGFHAFHEMGLENSTIATWMQAAGYHTALIGKYLNEYGTNNSQAFVPPGWDEWYAQLYDQNFYNISLNQNGSVVSYGSAESDYSTDVYARLAIDFVQRAADNNQPFFLYLAPTAPHKPYTAALRHQNALPEITQAPRPPSFNEADVNDKPLYVKNLPKLNSTAISILDRNYRTKLQMLLAVDEMIGSLIATLEAKGELENTYFIFTSDSGTALAEHRLDDIKGSPYTETTHIPMMIRAPGMTNTATVRNEIVTLPDLAPTIAALAGASTDTFVDGSSFAGLLNSTPANDWRQRILLEYQGGSPAVSFYYALRSGQHLYAEYNTGEKELYDLQNDPYQLCNLLGIDAQNLPADCFAGAQPPTPEFSQELATQLQALETCVAADCATAEH